MYRICLLIIALTFPRAALAAPSTSEQAIEQEELMNAIDAASAELLKPGPRRAGWDKGGLDLAKAIEAMPGGSERNFFISTDEDGKRMLTIIGATSLAAIPADWKSLETIGAAMPQRTMLTIAHFDGPYYFAGWQNERRVGDAYCSVGSMGGRLYERGGATAAGEMPAEIIPILLRSMVKVLAAKPICWRYDRSGDGFATRTFTPDGLSLPGLDKLDELMTIVPAGDVEAMLDGKVARP